MSARLTFHGGAGTVTGANFLLDLGSTKLLVDCGILQQEYPGGCDTVNFEAFPYEPAEMSALLVTHAHADHIGRIPKLVRDGFRGTIYSTAATRDIAAIMFADALHVMEEHAVKHGCDLLYEKKDIDDALARWQTHNYHEAFSIGDASVELYDAGHILGSSVARITRDDRSILFTGDLGNTPEPLLRDTEVPTGVEYVVIESVYGDRVHEARDERRDNLRFAIEEARARENTLLIPSFSLERTQILLYEINAMVEDKVLDPIPVYLDSPLASKITEVFRRYPELFNDAARERLQRGDDPFAFPGLNVTKNTAESGEIHRARGAKIVIAGAGMSGGGRVRAHEKYYLGDPRASILFVGYQAPGTLGRRIQDGQKKVQIDGEYIRVHAQISTLTGYSGHADRDQLLSFIEHAGEKLERAFVTMGEPRASLFLAQRAKDFLGIDCVVPEKGTSVEIDL